MLNIDIVVGNPPYNNGIDLDFVDKSIKINSRFIEFITPAKWQTADKNQIVVSKEMNYESFREKAVPLMSTVVFYPYCKDVFDILQVDGITYYLIDKAHKSECKVVNKSNHFDFINSEIVRDIKQGQTLWNIGIELLDSMRSYDRLKISDLPKDKKHQVWMNIQIPGGGTSTIDSRRAVLSLGDAKIFDRDACNEHSPATCLVYSADSIEECNNFLSYMYSSLVGFLLLINTSKLTGIINDNNFKFVPKEDDFSHPYSDEYLKRKYSLSDRYIDMISALVKHRAIKL